MKLNDLITILNEYNKNLENKELEILVNDREIYQVLFSIDKKEQKVDVMSYDNTEMIKENKENEISEFLKIFI